mgnify:CR=1 FL=1
MSKIETSAKSQALIETKYWFERAVIGLNLCPFAHKPAQEGLIRFVACREGEVRSVFSKECRQLMSTPREQLSTTLIVVYEGLTDFFRYNDSLADIEAWLASERLTGDLQVASFHPDYQFAGTHPDERQNYTNRSPYPIYHLIREQELSEAIDKGYDTDRIPERNIETLELHDQNRIETNFTPSKDR